MRAEDLISEHVPPLREGDELSTALGWMHEFKLHHLPVVLAGRFQGLLSEEELLAGSDLDGQVDSEMLVATEARVFREAHLYDVLKVMIDSGSDIVAVVGDKNLDYLGVVRISDLIEELALNSSWQMPGGILVLSLGEKDYSLAEISRLIEAEGVKVLSSAVSSTVKAEGGQELMLTLKLNQEDLGRVVATLERFEYQVVGSFKEDLVREDQKGRYNALMQYLDLD